jgi:uncharacterized protein YdhG (YjbR/CyaY superfamily)
MLQNAEVNRYINSFSEDIALRLILLRNMVIDLAPDAVEEFSYAMIGYKLHQKPMIYFGAYKKHIGVYALPLTHILFSDQLAAYKKGKGSVQFLHSKELPLELIRKMILFRVTTLNKDF